MLAVPQQYTRNVLLHFYFNKNFLCCVSRVPFLVYASLLYPSFFLVYMFFTPDSLLLTTVSHVYAYRSLNALYVCLLSLWYTTSYSFHPNPNFFKYANQNDTCVILYWYRRKHETQAKSNLYDYVSRSVSYWLCSGIMNSWLLVRQS
jgi:hypothetical protein